jgi:hypothetical protein
MRIIANALGLPYELVLKDFSKTNQGDNDGPGN